MPHNPVDERIRELYDLNNGTVTPDMVIEDAKNPDSPLHGEFNWNVDEVAMQAWRDKARRLIRRVKVVIETEDIVFHGRGRREFISDPGKDKGTQGYISRADLRTDRERAYDALRAEIRRIESAIERVREVAEDIGLDDEIEIISQSIVQLKDRMSAA
jgi:hypothetical protein